ncbi:MAG: hypothetical protein QT00_C0002G0079 [archaeon GW2011_AR5]|nr:MAG: hypothetical protein QT00_C0002G0079 [archaeon GW2011_AR5]
MESGGEKLGPFLLKALSCHQLLILREISKTRGETSTALLTRISREKSIPLSTLKLNFKKLKSSGAVTHENSRPVRLNKTGMLILRILEESP